MTFRVPRYAEEMKMPKVDVLVLTQYSVPIASLHRK
jgi:hypothetical protein